MMSNSALLSRRTMFSLLGVAAGTAIMAQPTESEAQTSGMERRQERRGERVERRYERRGGKKSQPQQPAQTQTAPAQKQQ